MIPDYQRFTGYIDKKKNKNKKKCQFLVLNVTGKGENVKENTNESEIFLERKTLHKIVTSLANT